MKEENKWFHVKFAETISFLAYVNAQISFALSFTDEIDQWKTQSDENNSAFKWLQSMQYLRMIFWWIVLFIAGVFCPCICLMLCVKGEKVMNIPVVKTILEKKARRFNPEKDVECKECIICMEDFSVDDD